ncbi:heteromeric transposase endonuclease subunit TnsA [Hippea alviniae]|uniref:heteromeric transposase endonuclease subunit TnsA n=1 Tax=Hippea alviniae TaxID=1279027 RepID=UPI0003B4CE75|nr:heteromeric transposase endonuclease subunit TnsA [Hippea alviniae]
MESKRPVRDIPIQSFSVSGKFPSIKNQRTVYYESQLELDFIYHLEFSPEVESYLEQPCKIKSPTGKFYIPDFLVVFKNSTSYKPLLVEIKSTEDIEKNFERLSVKFKTLREYAFGNGYDFKIITDKELKTTRTKNYRFLYGYINPQPKDAEFVSEILQLVKEHQPIKIEEIIRIFNKENPHKRAVCLSCLWHLIATSVLRVNLDENIAEQSKVFLNNNTEEERLCLLWK